MLGASILCYTQKKMQHFYEIGLTMEWRVVRLLQQLECPKLCIKTAYSAQIRVRDALPHGPHPGAIERSIGKTATEELAVMIDPFNPVKITKDAMNLEVEDYYKSWLEAEVSWEHHNISIFQAAIPWQL